MRVEAATLNDAFTDATTPCHLYFIYADDETIPDFVMEKTIIHVDLMASEREPDRWEVRDCRPLHPHVRLHSAAVVDQPPAPPEGHEHGTQGGAGGGAGGGGGGGRRPASFSTLKLYGFVKPPREEPVNPELVLEDLDRRNKAIRAALRGGKD